MNKHSFTYSSIAMLVVLAIAITMSPTNIGNTEPSYAQSFDAPSSLGDSIRQRFPTDAGVGHDGENFQQFMECLFGPEASEEDISSALEGNSDSTPTEQEIRDCFAPLYNTVPQLRLAVVPLVGLTIQVKMEEQVAPTAQRHKMNLKVQRKEV